MERGRKKVQIAHPTLCSLRCDKSPLYPVQKVGERERLFVHLRVDGKRGGEKKRRFVKRASLFFSFFSLLQSHSQHPRRSTAASASRLSLSPVSPPFHASIPTPCRPCASSAGAGPWVPTTSRSSPSRSPASSSSGRPRWRRRSASPPPGGIHSRSSSSGEATSSARPPSRRRSWPHWGGFWSPRWWPRCWPPGRRGRG